MLTKKYNGKKKLKMTNPAHSMDTNQTTQRGVMNSVASHIHSVGFGIWMISFGIVVDLWASWRGEIVGSMF